MTAPNAELSELQRRYVDPQFYYRMFQGPREVRDEEMARREGLNCIALAYLAIEGLHRCCLLRRLDCYETFRDHDRFISVDSLREMQTGDLVWFGRAGSKSSEDFIPKYDDAGELLNWRDSPASHVAIYTGSQQEGGDYLMLHASDRARTNAIQPLQEIMACNRYQYINRISRLDIAGMDVLPQVSVWSEYAEVMS